MSAAWPTAASKRLGSTTNLAAAGVSGALAAAVAAPPALGEPPSTPGPLTGPSPAAVERAVQLQRYPCALVWAPIPVLTWLLPCVGHIGITNSTCTIFDFAGPYTVNEDDFLFGRPTRWLPLDPQCAPLLAGPSPTAAGGDADVVGETSIGAAWDRHVRITASLYRTYMYNLLTRNCHVFVADTLNSMYYGSSSNMDPVRLTMLMAFKGRFTSWRAAAYSLLPSVVLITLGVVLGGWMFVMIYALTVAPLIAWFLFFNFVLYRRKPEYTRLPPI